MAIQVKLDDIINEMDVPFEGSYSYLNKETGEIVFLTSDDMRAAEEDEPFDDLPDWQQESRMAAMDVVENEEDYIEIPTRYDVNEYEIIENFCLTVREEVLLRAIKGKGAFGRFRDKIRELDFEKQWYSYRNEWFKEILIEWCRENQIDYIDWR